MHMKDFEGECKLAISTVKIHISKVTIFAETSMFIDGDHKFVLLNVYFSFEKTVYVIMQATNINSDQFNNWTLVVVVAINNINRSSIIVWLVDNICKKLYILIIN